MNLGEYVIKQTIDNGRFLLKVTPENKKEVNALIKECKEDGTLRMVPWACGKVKYVLFVDNVGIGEKEGKVLEFKRKAA